MFKRLLLLISFLLVAAVLNYARQGHERRMAKLAAIQAGEEARAAAAVEARESAERYSAAHKLAAERREKYERDVAALQTPRTSQYDSAKAEFRRVNDCKAGEPCRQKPITITIETKQTPRP